MKELAASILMTMCGGAMNAQPVVDITLVSNEADSLLEVFVRPHTDFDQVVSGITFTLRWDTISGDGLGTRQQFCPAAFSLSSTPTVVDSGSYFRTYNGFGSALLSDEGCPWFACEEHLIMTVPVNVDGGFGPFEIVAFSFLGDTASTGIIYTSGEPCLSMAIGDAEEDEAKDVLVFPNPSTSALTITLPVGQQMPASIDVIAADGRITRLVHDRAGTFDVRSLRPGAYSLRAGDVQGHFVKQ
jgi:hypothetical protein